MVTEAKMPFGGAYQNFGSTFGRAGYGRSRFDDAEPFEGHYDTPGWQSSSTRLAASASSTHSSTALSRTYDLR